MNYRQNEFVFSDNKVCKPDPEFKKDKREDNIVKESFKQSLFEDKVIENRERNVSLSLQGVKSMSESNLEEEKFQIDGKLGFSNTPNPDVPECKSLEEEDKYEEKRHSTRLQNKNINYELLFDEINESKFLKESFSTDVKGRKCPESRWGRSEDKHLFKLIRDMEEQGILTLREILQINSRSNVYKHEGL